MTTPQGNTDDTLQGLATLDTAQRQARIILGGGPAGPEGVTVKHIDPAMFGHPCTPPSCRTGGAA